jgi:hypothetical protein
MIAAALAPYRLWIMLAAIAALFGGGVYSGHRWATTVADAARARQVVAHLAQLRAETRRADAATAALATAESRIVTKTVEVIRHVPTVTTGRLCFGADAVRMLQPGTDWGPYQPASEPAGQGAAHAAASDRDVAYWAAEANRLYETCAARMNALADWHATATEQP